MITYLIITFLALIRYVHDHQRFWSVKVNTSVWVVNGSYYPTSTPPPTTTTTTLPPPTTISIAATTTTTTARGVTTTTLRVETTEGYLLEESVVEVGCCEPLNVARQTSLSYDKWIYTVHEKGHQLLSPCTTINVQSIYFVIGSLWVDWTRMWLPQRTRQKVRRMG